MRKRVTVRHALALGYGVEPRYEGDEIVDWQPNEGTVRHARAVGAFVREHPRQFDSKTEPSIIGVIGGYAGIAAPNKPVPPVGKREGDFMARILREEFGIDPNVIDISSIDTFTNAGHANRLIFGHSDPGIREVEFSPDNALAAATNPDHFWRVGPILQRALLRPETDPTAIQLINASDGFDPKRVAANAVGTALVHGIFAQLNTPYRDADAMDAAAEAFRHLTQDAGRAEIAATALQGIGIPMPTQPFVAAANHYGSQPPA